MKKYLLLLATLAVVLTLNLAGCGGGGGGGGGNSDSDGDGIPNNQDAFPNDASRFAAFTQGDLTPLQGSTFSSAMAINDAGLIVGTSNDITGDVHGVIWASSTATPIKLEFPPHPGNEFGAGYAINSTGDVVGETNNATGGRDAVFFLGIGGTPQASSAVVLTPVVGTNIHAAYDINSARRVVGESQEATGTKAVAWTITVAGTVATSSPPTMLGEPAGATASSAYAISEDNTIVGEYTLNGVVHGSLWTLGTTGVPNPLIDLPPLPGDAESVAYGINAGRIVGESTSAAGVTHSVTWTVAGSVATPVALGTTAEGNALAINSSGRLAGWTASAAGAANASVWDTRNLTLSDKVLAATTFSQGYGINTAGSIVGMGGTTGTAAFIAVPK